MVRSNKLNENVLAEVLGEDSTEVIRLIDTPMKDTEVSEELECETSKVRIILNELLVKNLVHLDRDRLDTGYCHYRWVRREDKIQEYVDEYVDRRIRQLDDMLDEDDAIVFECGCQRVDYGTAIEKDFECIDCGRRLRQVSAGKGSRKVKQELKRLEAIRQAS